MFKPIICTEYQSELISNPDEIANTLAAIYANVSSTESYPLNFLARNDEVEHNSEGYKHTFDFECEEYRTYNVPSTMRKLQSAIRAAVDTVVGLDNISYWII